MEAFVLNSLAFLRSPAVLVRRHLLMGVLALNLSLGFASSSLASLMTFDTNTASNQMSLDGFPRGNSYEEGGIVVVSQSDFSRFIDNFDGTPSSIAFYFHGNDQYIEFSLTNGMPFNLESFDLISNGYTDQRWVETSKSGGARTAIGGPTTWTHKTFSGPDFTDITWFRVATPWYATAVDNIRMSPSTVATTYPARGATQVPTNAIVTVTFRQAMDSISLTTNTLQSRDSVGILVPATVSYDTNSQTATLSPLVGLAEASSYLATVTHEARVQSGDGLDADYSWRFWTTGLLANVVWVGGSGDWNTAAN